MSQVRTRPYVDEGEGTITWQRTQDIEPILEANKRRQNEPQKWAGGGDARWHHLAEIPNVIIEKWMNEDGVNLIAMRGEEFAKFIKKKLRDPDNAWLRATNRRL